MTDEAAWSLPLDEEQNADGSWKRVPSPVQPGDIYWFRKSGEVVVVEHQSDSLQPPWSPQCWYCWDLKTDTPYGPIRSKALKDEGECIGRIHEGSFMTDRIVRYQQRKKVGG